jgi:hypothetical protein
MELLILLAFLIGWAVAQVQELQLRKARLLQLESLESELVRVKAQLLVLQKDLDSAQLVAQDSQLQLRRLTAKEKARETALQWDLG